MRSNIRQLVFALLLVITSYSTAADDDYCKDNPKDCSQVGKWEFGLGLGLGVRTNPLEDGDNIPLILVPQISYYGKSFFINNLDFGFTLVDKPRNMINIVASPGFDRVFFSRNDLQNFFLPIDGGGGVSVGGPATDPDIDPVAEDPPVFDDAVDAPVPGDGPDGAAPPDDNPDFDPGDNDDPVDDAPINDDNPSDSPTDVELPDRDRRVTYLAGIEWLYQGNAFNLQFSYLQEITNRHRGSESRFAIAVPIGKKSAAWNFSIGSTWKSSESVTYHYGEPNLLELGSALSPFVKLSYNRPLNKKWSLKAFARYEQLGDSIVETPLVTDDQVVSFFAGCFYKF